MVWHPRVIGYASNLGLVILEDLGDCPSLADLLLGTDAAAAERGLVAWARTLGAIHAASAGSSGLDEFEAGWERRAGRPAPRRRAIGQLRERWAAIIDGSTREVGVVAPSGVERDLVRALYDAVEAGPFLAYSTGDPCPGNFLFRSDGSACVVDVEYGAYRHTLVDGDVHPARLSHVLVRRRHSHAGPRRDGDGVSRRARTQDFPRRRTTAHTARPALRARVMVVGHVARFGTAASPRWSTRTGCAC